MRGQRDWSLPTWVLVGAAIVGISLGGCDSREDYTGEYLDPFRSGQYLTLRSDGTFVADLAVLGGEAEGSYLVSSGVVTSPGLRGPHKLSLTRIQWFPIHGYVEKDVILFDAQPAAILVRLPSGKKPDSGFAAGTFSVGQMLGSRPPSDGDVRLAASGDVYWLTSIGRVVTERHVEGRIWKAEGDVIYFGPRPELASVFGTSQDIDTLRIISPGPWSPFAVYVGDRLYRYDSNAIEYWYRKAHDSPDVIVPLPS